MNQKTKITGFADEMAEDLRTQIKGLKTLDMSYVEMRGVDGNNLIFHTDEKVKEIKRCLDANGIHLSALGSPIGKIGITDDFQPHFESYQRAVEIAHKMDTPNIRMFSFYLPENDPISAWEGAVMDRMGQMIDYAIKNDVVLLHENEKGIFGEKAKECKKLMDNFYGDHFKVIFDFANFVQAKENTLEGYALLKEYIAYIHVKDAMLIDGAVVPAGYGNGHVAEILKDLFCSGFDGFLSIEPHLFNFAGFAELEKDGSSIHNTEHKVLSGEESFALAHKALMTILEKL